MKHMNLAFRFIVVALVAVLAGCASVTNSDTQQISITTRDKAGFAVTGAECTWRNSKGEGRFRTPAVVAVRRDYQALNIICSRDGLPDAADAFNSKSTSAMVGNILAGGPIGAAIDHTSGAGYDYPAVLTVWFASLDSNKPAAANQERKPFKIEHVMVPPPATGFAKVDDVDAVPRLGSKGRELYLEWLSKPFPRAVAVSDKGAMARGYGSHAMQQAVQNCEKLFGNPCRLYAVDDQVVWKSE